MKSHLHYCNTCGTHHRITGAGTSHITSELGTWAVITWRYRIQWNRSRTPIHIRLGCDKCGGDMQWPSAFAAGAGTDRRRPALPVSARQYVPGVPCIEAHALEKRRQTKLGLARCTGHASLQGQSRLDGMVSTSGLRSHPSTCMWLWKPPGLARSCNPRQIPKPWPDPGTLARFWNPGRILEPWPDPGARAPWPELSQGHTTFICAAPLQTTSGLPNTVLPITAGPSLPTLHRLWDSLASCEVFIWLAGWRLSLGWEKGWETTRGCSPRLQELQMKSTNRSMEVRPTATTHPNAKASPPHQQP